MCIIIVTMIGRGCGAMLVLIDLYAYFDSIDHFLVFLRNIWTCSIANFLILVWCKIDLLADLSIII